MDKEKTREELLEELAELHSAIEELEEENQQLHLRVEAGSRGGGKKGGKGKETVDDALHIAELQQEIETLISDKERNAAELAALQEKLSESASAQKSAQQSKLEAEAQSKEYLRKIQTLESEMEKLSRQSRTMEQQSKEASKQKTAGIKETQRLFDENDQLREENKKLVESLHAHEESLRILESHLLQLTEERDELQLGHEKFDLVKEELQNHILQLEYQVDQATSKLQVAQDSENNALAKIEALRADAKQKLDSIAEELKAARMEISQLKKENAQLKDSTVVGEKQRELDRERAENKDNVALIEHLRVGLENAIAERDQLASRLLEDESKVGMLVAERVVKEKEHNRDLERRLENLKQKLDDETEKVTDLERGRQALVAEIDDLLSWKTIYENGHGLQELAKNMKSLKDNNRRLSMAVDQLTGRVGMLMDANGLLSHAFDRLKKECGKDPNFNYSEYELQEELSSEKARLKAQVAELEEQVNSLEEECVRLRKALKNQAGVVGEQGFKYAGMSADQLMKVNEFASNLKDGITDLPLNDRSAELLRENRILADEISMLKLQISAFEREFGASAGNADQRHQQQLEVIQAGIHASSSASAGLNKKQEAELFGLREDVQRLIHENGELRDGMMRMQSEVMILLRSQGASGGAALDSMAGGNSQEELMRILLLNESLIHENTELKRNLTGNRIVQPQQQYQHVQHPTPVRRDSPALAQPQEMQHTSSGPMQGTLMLHPTTTGVLQGTLQRPPLGQAAGQMRVPPMAHTPVGRNISQPLSLTPNAAFGATGMFGQTYNAPSTPHGKQMLTKQISHMNLPPEEWAEEVRDMNGQLVECLEQLFEREQELEEHKQQVAGMETTLVAIKQQMASLYYEYTQRADAWEEREKHYKSEISQLREAKEDLSLRVSKSEGMIDLARNGTDSSKENLILDLNRKVLVLEVNENVLSRKFLSLNDQLKLEQDARRSLERDFVEMESTLKKRVLYLEQYKAAMSSRLGHLQGRLNKSVPVDDFLQLQKELDNLREDHLLTLRREVEARVLALKSQENSTQVRLLKSTVIQLQADLVRAEGSVKEVENELEHQKMLTEKALINNFEVAGTVSDMAKYRGEASRLKVELDASQKRCELQAAHIQQLSREADANAARILDLQAREEEAARKESDARKRAVEATTTYEGGLPRSKAAELQSQLSRLTQELEESQLETNRLKELAEIASSQVQTVGSFRSMAQDEARELREHCARLESQGDDELIIGRLQRQLMSTKTSYKAFARKYQSLRSDVRQREIALRLLETKLDQREEAALNVLETHRMEMAALKKALQHSCDLIINDHEVNSTRVGATKSEQKKKKTAELVPVGRKLIQVSEKVQNLSEMAKNAENRAIEAEEISHKLTGQVGELQVEHDLLQQKCRDLEALTQANTKQNVLAARLVSLTDDVRVNKLTVLKQQRQIQTLKAEKAHLQKLVANMEVDVEDLEQNRVLAETKHLLAAQSSNAISQEGAQESDAITMLGPSGGGFEDTIAAYQRLRHGLVSLPVETGHQERGGSQDAVVDSTQVDELMEKLEHSNQLLAQVRKDESNLRLELQRQAGRNDELIALLKEKDDQLAHCERVFHEHGLPSLMGNDNIRPHGAHHSNQSNAMLMEEQNKLQQAATATVSSLRALLDEKNRQLDKYRERIEELQRERKVKSRADRRAEELLESVQQVPGGTKESSRDMREFPETTMAPSQHAKLLHQIEQADELLQDKDRTIAQLEQKLLAQINQRERAELRCGSTLKELDIMQKDMARTVAMLQASEEQRRVLEAIHSKQATLMHAHDKKAVTISRDVHRSDVDVRPLQDTDPIRVASAIANEVELKELADRKNASLLKSIQKKDEKIKGYRDMIVRLKEEFVKSEEEKAVAMMRLASQAGSGQGSAAGMISSEEAKELKNQILALRDGLRQAKDDVEKGKKAREKLNQARVKAEEETEKTRSQVELFEAQCAAAQESLLRTRKELEDSRRREVKLKEKLKEMFEAEAGNSKIGDLKSANEQILTLQREVEILQAQNATLRMVTAEAQHNAPASTTTAGAGGTEPAGTQRQLSSSANPQSAAFSSGPWRTLGEAPPPLPHGDGTSKGMEDYRQQMHAKWENEKKLQKRVAVLEKRLQEKVDENDDLQNQLQRAREVTQSSVVAKEEMQKKVASGAKLAHETRRLTVDDLNAVNEAQSKIFALEEENSKLKRRLEVDSAAEIISLRSQLAGMREREQELLQQLDDSESRRKGALKRPDGPRSLRDSEDRFMLEEQLRDELEKARRAKREVEAALLDRDSRAMEHRFDLEAKDGELDRLRRRNRELELAYHTATAATGGASTSSGGKKPGAAGGVTTLGGKSKQDDYEGTIEAMKRVVEKLQAENANLRRTGVQEDDRKLAEFEKRAAAERKRADKLEATVKELQSQLGTFSESNQKMIQRQQMIANLRKQLKTKEDETVSVREQLDRVMQERDEAQRRISSMQTKVQQLEVSLQHGAHKEGQQATATAAASTANNRQQQELVAQQQREIAELKSRVINLSTEVETARAQASRGGAQRGGGATAASASAATSGGIDPAEFDRLKKENEKLRNELAAFDLDFFEDIENLKFAYAEAMRKIKMYESGGRR